jgi:hypothetical protein
VSLEAAVLGTVMKDAEPRTSAAGKPWISLMVRSGEGDAQQVARLAVFGEAALTLGRVEKGEQIYATGSIKLGEWTDRNHEKRVTQIYSPGFRATVLVGASVLPGLVAILVARSAHAEDEPPTTDCQIRDSGVFTPTIAKAIKEGAAAVRADPNVMVGIAYSRSHGDPDAVSGDRKLLIFLTEEEMRRVSGGKGNFFNARDSIIAAAVTRAFRRWGPEAPDPKQERASLSREVGSDGYSHWCGDHRRRNPACGLAVRLTAFH